MRRAKEYVASCEEWVVDRDRGYITRSRMSYLACVRPKHGTSALQESCFSGAFIACDDNHIARKHLEVDVSDCSRPARGAREATRE